ncbi:murein transglycosylase A [Acidimangrovimonas pyrenivorans]
MAATVTGAAAGPRAQTLRFDQLKGWAKDDFAAALSTFLVTCPRLKDPDWHETCAAARLAGDDPRGFFESYFRPVLLGDPKQALFTGYYEPELTASATRTPRFAYPIYRRPPELRPGAVWYSRAEIETRHLLAGRGLEIAWLDNPVDAFFLQVQGSGRLHLTDGRILRVGFDGKNGHPYRSVGREMARRGLLPKHRVSAARIRSWVKDHPDRGMTMLRHNPSYVFFRVLRLAANRGPLGAMRKPVTAGRSIAVDPDYVPLGAPVWVEKTGRNPLRRLMIAQDTGSAIKGPQRADIFYGSGAKAGRIASHVRDGGRMVVLLPVARALAMENGG